MLRTLANAWKIADLRKKILFTALIVLIFRIGAAIPVPFVAAGANGIFSDSQLSGTFMEYLNMMTGNAFNYGTIFAMSITPYINSSIIIQLLTVAIPALERLAKDGEEGRKKIATITRYVTVALALLQSTAYYFYLRGNNFLLMKDVGVFADIFQALVIILCFSAGCALIMWLGEQINDKGIGNGISIILFAGIVARIPSIIASFTLPSIRLYAYSACAIGSVIFFVAFFILNSVNITGTGFSFGGMLSLPSAFSRRCRSACTALKISSSMIRG